MDKLINVEMMKLKFVAGQVLALEVLAVNYFRSLIGGRYFPFYDNDIQMMYYYYYY